MFYKKKKKIRTEKFWRQRKPVLYFSCAFKLCIACFSHGLGQVFKNFHQFKNTGFEEKLSDMEHHQEIQLQSIFVSSTV